MSLKVSDVDIENIIVVNSQTGEQTALEELRLGEEIVWQKTTSEKPFVLYVDETRNTNNSSITFLVTTGDTAVDVVYGGVTKTVAANSSSTTISFSSATDGTPTEGLISFEGGVSQASIRGYSASADGKGATTIHNCVKYLESWGSLKNIGQYLFAQSDITEINIPKQITAIGDSAFEECLSLTKVTIPNTLNILLRSTFKQCSALYEVVFEDGYIGVNDELGAIASYPTFSGCTNLTKVTLPSSIEYLPQYTFGTDELNNLSINSDTIGVVDLRNCPRLLSPVGLPVTGPKILYFPDTVTDIGIPASTDSVNTITPGYIDLRSLTNLKNVIALNLTNYYSTPTATRIDFAPNLTTLPFDGTFSNGACTSQFYKWLSLNMVNSDTPGVCDLSQFTDLGYGLYLAHDSHSSFSMCGFEQVIFNSSINDIPYGFMKDCPKLSKVTIPSSVTEIRWRAFASCGLEATQTPQVIFENKVGWQYDSANGSSVSASNEAVWVDIPEETIADATAIAVLRFNLADAEIPGYATHPWRRVEN